MDKKEGLLKSINEGVLRGAQTKLAGLLGITPTTVSDWFKGKDKPSESYIKKMSKIFKKSEQELKEIFSIYSQKNLSNMVEARIELDYIPVRGISSAKNEKFILEETESFLPYRKTGENQFAIKITGNCMVDPEDPSHSIYDGDFIIVDPDIDPLQGDVVLARIDDEYSTVKRFYIHGENIHLVPDNPQYKKLIYELSRVHIVGKVIDVYKPMKRKKERA